MSRAWKGIKVLVGSLAHLHMNAPQNEFDGAQRVLKIYYRELAKQMAEEIIERKEDFESPGFASQADEIVEKYALKLHQLCHVFSALGQFAFRDKPEAKEPLGKGEFRCFGCGGVTRQNDQSCRTCGWSWK
jgi:hypothetical protein